MIRRPPKSTLFPSPTLSRSCSRGELAAEACGRGETRRRQGRQAEGPEGRRRLPACRRAEEGRTRPGRGGSCRRGGRWRSGEHTTELQLQSKILCRLLPDKKK